MIRPLTPPEAALLAAAAALDAEGIYPGVRALARRAGWSVPYCSRLRTRLIALDLWGWEIRDRQGRVVPPRAVVVKLKVVNTPAQAMAKAARPEAEPKPKSKPAGKAKAKAKPAGKAPVPLKIRTSPRKAPARRLVRRAKVPVLSPGTPQRLALIKRMWAERHPEAADAETGA